MKIGYMCVFEQDQALLDNDVAEKLGAEKVFIDQVRNSSKDRPELEKLLAFVREGDTVIVENLNSFAKNARDFLGLIKRLVDKSVAFVSKEEAIDTTTPTGKYLLTVFDAMAQIGQDRTRRHQAKGIAAAKVEGKYTGRKPVDVPESALAEQYWAWKHGEISPEIAAKNLKISRTTFYRRVEEYEKKLGIRAPLYTNKGAD